MRERLLRIAEFYRVTGRPLPVDLLARLEEAGVAVSNYV